MVLKNISPGSGVRVSLMLFFFSQVCPTNPEQFYVDDFIIFGVLANTQTNVPESIASRVEVPAKQFSATRILLFNRSTELLTTYTFFPDKKVEVL